MRSSATSETAGIESIRSGSGRPTVTVVPPPPGGRVGLGEDSLVTHGLDRVVGAPRRWPRGRRRIYGLRSLPVRFAAGPPS